MIDVDGRAVGCRSVEDFIDRGALNRIFLPPEVQRVNPARALCERLGFAMASETSTHFGMEAAPPGPPAQ